MFEKALLPIASNPQLCEELENVQRSVEQVIDEISQDTITRADFVVDAESRAKETVESFRQFLDDHQDEITALQVYYSKPYAQRPTYADIKALADAIGKPPHRWTPEKLWDAYETLDESKVRGSAGTVLTNLVSLVRFTLGLDDELEPWPERVAERFDAWMLQQQQAGRTFTDDQTAWLALIRDHLAASLTIDLAELQDPPFSQHGGLFKARELFGQDLDTHPRRPHRGPRRMSELPESWEVVDVGEIATVQLGRQRSPKNHTGPHMRPYLRSANVTWRRHRHRLT